jgi:small subunit ribosomal protein S11
MVAWCSAGRLGFKGSRKSTAYVAQQIGADAARRAVSLGMREVEVRLKGPGAGRESAVRGIVSAGLEISLLKDVTPLPHNGCRPPKRRRV